MSGHIKLGIPNQTLRDYSLEKQGDGIVYERGPANPFGVTVNSSSPFDRVDKWGEWVQEDWQAGVGRVDPEAGGFLYAEAETRVPNQVILPPKLQLTDQRVLTNTIADCRYIPDNVAGSITVGSGSFVRAAMAFTTPGTLPVGFMGYYFLARVASGTSVTISVYSNSAGSPNASLVSATFSGTQPDRNFFWYGVQMSSAALSASTQYWLVIEPTSASDTIEVAYGSSGYNTVAKSYNGSAWANISSTYLVHMTGMHRLEFAGTLEKAFIRFNGSLYSHVGEALYKLDTVNENFDSVGTITGAGNVTSMAVYGPNLFFGRSSGNYTTMNTSDVFSAASATRKLFLEFKGLLFSAWQNDLYYSNDGSTWSAAFPVGGDDSEIRGMAGMGDSVYLATDKALFRFAPGDVVEEVTRFGAEDATNGVGMIGYQGRLYIPVGGRLFRFDPSGQMMDIWINREDDLPASQIGIVSWLTRMNNWLVAYVSPTVVDSRPSLWMWQEEGWHFIACAPQTGAVLTETLSTYYDRATKRLWFACAGTGPFYVGVEDYTLNPFNSSSYLYMPYGWLEQDRFYGGLKLIDKSWESVTISGDNLSSGVKVSVYWKDEGSTAWELLGTATADGQELRWNNYTTRPNGKWIKLGLLLQTNDGDETPRIRAVTVKYLPYPNDRIQDSMTISITDFKEMPFGDKSTYTLSETKTHFESLIASVNPIIYQDPFGTQYEVTITQWRYLAPRYDVTRPGGTPTGRIAELRVPIVVEQIPDTVYSG